MYNAGKIIPGLVVFLALATVPIWYNVASGHEAVAPEIEKPKGETQCVADAEYMRREHMQLLSDWRDEVVRNGDRVYVTADGRQYDKSLTRTCLVSVCCSLSFLFLQINPSPSDLKKDWNHGNKFLSLLDL